MMILHIPLVPPPPPASNHWSTLWTKIKIFVWFWSILPQRIFVLNFGSLSYELRKSKSKKIQTLSILFSFFSQILKKKDSFEDFALKCFHVCIEVPKMQDQGCVVHAAMPVRKIEKTLSPSSVVCPFVQRRSNAGCSGGGQFWTPGNGM